MSEKVKVGDVWVSDASGRESKITRVEMFYVRFKNPKTGTEGTCGINAFVSRRRLIERDGKAVA